MRDIKLNQAECIFGFAAWLTTRDEVTKFGGSEECSTAADRVKEFIMINDLGDVSDDWPNNLLFPLPAPPKGEQE